MSDGPRAALQIAWIDSPVGLLRVGASDTAVHLLQFVNEQKSCPHSSDDHPILEQARGELAEYFAGTRRVFDVPISFAGTPFQKRVWTALCSIRYGERVSYLEQSRMVGDELAIRAVAQANGQNPIAILIPCHRVINASGRLGGFGGGLLRKQFLLDLERGDRLL
jgi:methylated-DNA-[protein]-cysteine S-methyltransferase